MRAIPVSPQGRDDEQARPSEQTTSVETVVGAGVSVSGIYLP